MTKTNNSNQRGTINYTPGKGFKVKLRGKKRSKGYVSLFLDYYLGTVKDATGKSKIQRKYEYLNIYLKDNPQSTEERQRNKNNLDLALSIRAKREDIFKNDIEGLPNPFRKKINFQDYFKNFVDNYENKDKRLVEACHKYFKKFTKDEFITANQIDEAFVIRFRNFLQDHLNGETPYNYFTKFKKLCKHATKDRIFNINPADEITVTRQGGIKKDILTLAEVAKLAKVECSNEHVKLAFFFCLNTGIRHVDAKALKWKNIDLDKGQIKITQAKVAKTSSNAIIYIDLNNNAKKILLKLEKGKPEENIFTLPSLTGSLKTIKTWVHKAEISKNITWHSARHSFATNLLINQTDIKTVSSLLGHTSLKHTQKYTHLVDELKEKSR
ncbi:MAG: site-specific integrase [Bacteroidales bacterium]|nr:site-specific integrase [Bacteroidales bacterium]